MAGSGHQAPRPGPYGLDGRTALVTGAAGGIGSAVVRLLAAYGTRVVAVDRDRDRLGEAVVELGECASAIEADVTDPDDVRRMAAEAEQAAGPVDFLVHTAGVLFPGTVHDISDEDWTRTFAVNTTGVFLVSRAVTARMRLRRSGAMVTVASNAADCARTHLAAYAASKAAAAAFTRCLGLELAPYGIRCNIVAPGSTDTGMLTRLLGDQARHTAVTGLPGVFRPGIPLGRVARPEDIAAAVAFLLSDRAAHITLHSLTVDGGATLGT